METLTNNIKIDNENDLINKLIENINESEDFGEYNFGPLDSKYKYKNKIKYKLIHTHLKKKLGHNLYLLDITKLKKTNNITVYCLLNKNEIKNYNKIDIISLKVWEKEKIIEILMKNIIYNNIINGETEKEAKRKDIIQQNGELNIYISEFQSKRILYIDTLLLNINYSSEFRTISFSLKKRTLPLNLDNINDKKIKTSYSLEEVDQIILNFDDLKHSLGKADARKSKIKFFTFNRLNIKETRVYHLTLLLNNFIDFFTKSNIKFERILFNPNKKEYISFNQELPIKKEVIVINNKKCKFTNYEKKSIKLAFELKNIKFSFYKNGRVITLKDYEDLSNKKDYNLLFISDTHIEEINEDLNYNIQYLIFNITEKKQLITGDYDFYTYFKYKNLQYKNSKLSYQNIILEDINNNEIINIDNCDDITYKSILSKQRIDIINNAISYKRIDYKIKTTPKFDRVIQEIKIKELLSSFSTISIDNLEDNQYSALYVFSKYRNKSKKETTNVIVELEFEIKDKNLFISSINNKSIIEIKEKYSFLKKDANDIKLLDEQFYLIDNKNNQYLSYYTNNNYIPLIIGSNTKDLIEEINVAEQSNTNLVKNNKNPILPYYGLSQTGIKKNKSERNYIYIQNHKDYFEYFVPSIQNEPAFQTNANLIYNGIIKDFNNNIVNDYEYSNLYNLFFRTMTQNIMSKDNNKTNLFEKLLKVSIFN